MLQIPAVNERGFLIMPGTYCYAQFLRMSTINNIPYVTFKILAGKFPYRAGSEVLFRVNDHETSFGEGLMIPERSRKAMIARVKD